jgi:tetratricopeptide (TPR) repeat protein
MQTALWDAIQAERLSPLYGKAALRRAAAREALQEYGLAIEAYDRAAALDNTLAKAVAVARARCKDKLGHLDDKVLLEPDD